MYTALVRFFLALLLSPLLFGVINRTKAFFAGRRGAPLLQLYYDIFKLLRKGAAYSVSTTWVFVAGPLAGFSAILVASMLVPFAGQPALIAFDGDIVLFMYLLGLARFFTVLAALDTASSFEGMGASREVQFAVFAEPAFFLSVATLARLSGSASLSGILAGQIFYSWVSQGPLICLILGALFIVLLAENARIPVDDPNTHLELTMIHEVMVLDHGGVDLAFILYGATVKFWILGAVLTGIVLGAGVPGGGMALPVFVLSMLALAVLVGVVESTLARLRLFKVPHFLIIASALSMVGFILALRQ